MVARPSGAGGVKVTTPSTSISLEVKCPCCGYDLSGTPIAASRARCPECGHLFDVRSPLARLGPAPTWSLLLGWSCAVIPAALAVIPTVSWLYVKHTTGVNPFGGSHPGLLGGILFFPYWILTICGVGPLLPLVGIVSIRRKWSHDQRIERVFFMWSLLWALGAACFVVTHFGPGMDRINEWWRD